MPASAYGRDLPNLTCSLSPISISDSNWSISACARRACLDSGVMVIEYVSGVVRGLLTGGGLDVPPPPHAYAPAVK